MATTLLIFLPVAACLFWLLVHLAMARKTSTYVVFIPLIITALGAFFTFSCYDSPYTSWRLLDISILVSLLFGPALVPFIWMYMERMRPGDKYQNPLQLLWIMAPVALFTAAIMIHMIAGGDTIVQFIERIYTDGHQSAEKMYSGTIAWHYHIWVAIVSRVVLAIEVIALLAMCITMSRRNDFRTKYLKKFFRGGKIKLRQLQMHVVMISITILSVKMALPRTFLIANIWVPVILDILITACISAISYLALYGDKEDISLIEMQTAWRYNYSRKDKLEVLDDIIDSIVDDVGKEALNHFYIRLSQRGVDVNGNVLPASATSQDKGLMARFRHIMIDEQLFLQTSLTLHDVAARLHSNKTYISKLVNDTYKQGFPELVNSLRVEYAKQYILDHRNAKQETIAQACGFLSASSFNSIFKKITGITPKVWLASNAKR